MAEELDWDAALASWRDEIDDDERWLWVSLAEAGDAAGVSKSALRTWYRSGEIPSRMEDGPNGPQRMVPLDAVLDRAARTRGRSAGGPGKSSSSAATAADAVEHLVALLGEQIERAEARAERAEAALLDALARAAAAEAELAVLRRS